MSLIDEDEYKIDTSETYRLALESILRWTDRSFSMDPDFRDSLIVRAIAQVAQVALESG